MIRPALALATTLVAAGAAAQNGAIVPVDGDTVLANGKTYRLVGFDTPERGERAKCPAERVLGGMAHARLQALIAQGGLELVEVRCSCAPGTHGTRLCNYGRACATLKVGGVDVGSILIAEGLARPFACWRYQCPMRRGWCR
jgi:endonuclease YncB( thermonuclease family)